MACDEVVVVVVVVGWCDWSKLEVQKGSASSQVDIRCNIDFRLAKAEWVWYDRIGEDMI
jgi:hypothetical protein